MELLIYILLLLYLTWAGYAAKSLGKRKVAICVLNLTAGIVLTGLLCRSVNAPVVRMVMFIITLLFAVKGWVYCRYEQKLSFGRWLCFCWFWVGMNPKPFQQPFRLQKPSFKEIGLAFSNLIVGLALAFFVRYLWLKPFDYYVCWLLCLLSISLIFHFGLLSLGRVLWSMVGIKLPPLFDAPYRSKSLAEFWGKRWNTAFVEMTTAIIFKPLLKWRPKWKGLALMATFLLSGIFHEIAITFPVLSDWGHPLLYFVLQGVFILTERELLKKHPAFFKKAGWIWTLGLLLLPLPLLFTKAFTTGILFPLLHLLPV